MGVTPPREVAFTDADGRTPSANEASPNTTAVKQPSKREDTVPPCCPWRLPSEPMLFANLRIYFADFPECTFLYVPEHSMLGDLMR